MTHQRLGHSATAGSDLAGLHRPNNPELEAAIAALPGYTETAEMLAALVATPVPRAQDVDIDGAAELIIQALAAGQTKLPPEVIKLLSRSDAERRATEALGLAMQRARVGCSPSSTPSCTTARRHCVSTCRDASWRWLRPRVRYASCR